MIDDLKQITNLEEIKGILDKTRTTKCCYCGCDLLADMDNDELIIVIGSNTDPLLCCESCHDLLYRLGYNRHKIKSWR